MADKDKLIKVAKELNELYKRKKAALPYSINVIRYPFKFIFQRQHSEIVHIHGIVFGFGLAHRLIKKLRQTSCHVEWNVEKVPVAAEIIF